MIEMLNVNCMDYLKSQPDGAFEIAIVDPPYGISITGECMGGRQTVIPDKDKTWDSEVPTAEYFEELFRVSKNQTIWGGNYFNLPPSRYFAIWDKGLTMYGRDFAECEFAWVRFGGTRICKTSPVQLKRFHPTQKPEDLYKFLLRKYAKSGDRILDTHGGSGSICLACSDLKFDLTWMELDPDYYKAACDRFKSHSDKQVLF